MKFDHFPADYFNCDGIASNGCEASVRGTAMCGGCVTEDAELSAGTNCLALPNVVAVACVGPIGQATCRVTGCNAGWANANGDAADGCEKQLR
eukprot:scaffold5.g909.t1